MSFQVRILDYNYLFQSNVAITASTSDDNYPVSNLALTQRSKIWKSNLAGNFTIEAGNNVIDFVSSAGTFAASVSFGTYNADTLATALAAAMNAQDTSFTYTVSYSKATGFWTIHTSGSLLSLLWNSGSHMNRSIGKAIGFGVLADSTGATTYVSPNIAIHTEEAIVIDLGSATDIDSLVMVFDAIDGNTFTDLAQFRLQANPTNTWGSPAYDLQGISVDQTYDVISEFLTSSQRYRYWRWIIYDSTNSNLQVQISKLSLALATQLSRIPLNGFSFEIDDQSQIQRTPYGQEYVDVYPTARMLSLNYQGLSYSDTQTLDQIFRRLGLTTPLVIALDSQASLYSHNHFLIWAKIGESLNPTQIVNAFFSNSMSFKEVF